MKTSNIKQIRLLYSLFGGILLICLGLFFSNIITAADESKISNMESSKDEGYVFCITDLQAGNELFKQQHSIDSLASGYSAHAHISSFAADFHADKNIMKTDPRVVWVSVMQWFNTIALVAIVVLAIIVLISFYRSTKQGRVFPKKQVSMLTFIGILILATTISKDTSTFLERMVAADLLEGSLWQPQVLFEIHMGRIFFGLTLIFISQIFRIGYEMQEDQELTI